MNIALIFAGGVGQRMGAEIPKQFLKVHNKEILVHTIELFQANAKIDQIVLVCVESWLDYARELVERYQLTKVARIIPGGNSGQDSIYRGLVAAAEIDRDAIVLIHDGVRPILSQRAIDECVQTTAEKGNAIPVLPAFETPIYSEDGQTVGNVVDRRKSYVAQAPQGFKVADILAVHEAERAVNPDYDGIVDSCSLMFKHGKTCFMFPGDRGNIKVTTPEDFFTLIGNLNALDYEQLLNLNA